MKFLFLGLALLLALPTFAAQKVVYVSGSGFQSGHCQANSSYFCIDQIERRAKEDAYRDAEWSCHRQNGDLYDSTYACSAYCNPSYVPPGQQAWVSCRGSCHLPCYIEE